MTRPASGRAAEKRTRPQAEAAALKWLDGLGDKGLVLAEGGNDTAFAVSNGDSAVGPVTKFAFAKPGFAVTFTFRGTHNAATPLKTLQANFWHAVIDRVPTPGLDLPGWQVRPQTPVSSFAKGVEIVAAGEGRLKVRVQTRFFAVYGRDPSIIVPADAPTPADAYFQIRRDFPLDLTIDAPTKAP